jgi:hypothetical protein
MLYKLSEYRILSISVIDIVLLLLIIFLIALILKKQNKNQIENYDGKISNLTLTQCGTECTMGENCRAFAYKPISSTCYLSKKNILGEPMESAYSKDYSKLDRRCNKINPINDTDFISDTTLTQNSVYVCSDGENNNITEFQYANLGASSLQTSDTVGGTAGRGVPTKIGENPDNTAPLAVNYDVYSIKYIDPEVEPLRDLEPNFPKLVKNTDEEIRNKNIIVKNEDNNKNAVSAFIQSDMEYLGQYLLGHQCVINVPLYDCLDFCASNDKCAGTEWNESITKEDGSGKLQTYKNVCCPKQVVAKIIPRRKENINGKFYVKTEKDLIKGRKSILLSRQDINKPNGLSDIYSTIANNPKFTLEITDRDRKTPDIYNRAQQDSNNVEPITMFLLPTDIDTVNFK